MLNKLLSESNLTYHGYWMGGSYNNNSWQWITGEAFSYTNFDEGEPNRSGDYLQTYTSGLWDDTISTGASHKHGFICEWERQENTIVYYDNDTNKIEKCHLNYGLDDCLTQSARYYNPSLAYMLSLLALSSYNKEGDDNFTLIENMPENSFPNNPLYITESLRNLGFNVKKNGDVIEKNYYSDSYAQDYRKNSTAYTISTKLTNNGTRVILIVIRGSFGQLNPLKFWKPWQNDWQSNVNFKNWNVGLHEGFSAAKEEIIDELNRFKLSKGITGNNIKYVLTGHSRGASVANLVSKDLIDSGVPTDNVYDYNFACPDTGRDYSNNWNPSGIYDSIYNINNVKDIVGVVPGLLFTTFLQTLTAKDICWGKYGHTYFFSNNWENTYDTALANLNPLASLNQKKKKKDDSINNEHSMQKYVRQMKKMKYINEFKSWEDARIKLLANIARDKIKNSIIGKIFSIQCPVDFEIIDSNGVKVADVVDGNINYYNNSFGNIIILVAGDQKVVYLSGTDDYYVKMICTDTGSMRYYVRDDLIDDEEVTEITYSEVVLSPGKQMLSIIDSNVSAGEVDLISLNSKLEPDMHIDNYGVECPMDDGAKEAYSDLPINETQFSISYELGGGENIDNPTVYTKQSNDITLTAPQKKDCVFVGWTGSNGDIPQKTVNISKGTEGNLSYIANWKGIDQNKDPLVEVLGASVRLADTDNNGTQSIRIGIQVKNANKARACAIKLNVGGKEYTVATEAGKGDLVQSSLHSKDIENNSVVYAVVLTNIPASELYTDIGITGKVWNINCDEYSTKRDYRYVAGIVSAIAEKYPGLKISFSDGIIYKNDGEDKLQGSDILEYSNPEITESPEEIPTPTPRAVQTALPIATPTPPLTDTPVPSTTPTPIPLPTATPVSPVWNDNYETQAKYELWTPSGASDIGMLGKEVIIVAMNNGGNVYAMSEDGDTITTTDITDMYFGDTLYIPTDYNLNNISWSTMWNKADGSTDMGKGYLFQNMEDQRYLGIWGSEVSSQGMPTGMTEGSIDYKKRFTWSSTLYSTYNTTNFLNFDGIDFNVDTTDGANVLCYVKSYTGTHAVKNTWHQVYNFTTGHEYLLVTSNTPGTAKAFYMTGTGNSSAYDGKDVTINNDGTITYDGTYNDTAVINAHSLGDGTFYLNVWAYPENRHTLSYRGDGTDQSLYLSSDNSLSTYAFRFVYSSGALKAYHGSSGKDTVMPVRWRTKSGGQLGIGNGSSNINEFYIFERDTTPQDYTPPAQKTYSRITDLSQIQNGDKVIMICRDGSHFMLPEAIEAANSYGSIRVGYRMESIGLLGIAGLEETIAGDALGSYEWTFTKTGDNWLIGKNGMNMKITRETDRGFPATLDVEGDPMTIDGSANAYTFSNGTYVLNYNSRGVISGYTGSPETFYLYKYVASD